MKKTSIFCTVFLTVWIIAVGCSVAEEPKKPEGLENRVSYSLGLNIGKGFKAQGIEIHSVETCKGFIQGGIYIGLVSLALVSPVELKRLVSQQAFQIRIIDPQGPG